MKHVSWLFFDLGNTLISEEAAADNRIRRLVDALERYGRSYSIDDVRSAFQKASAEFAPRLVAGAIEKLIDDPACRHAVLLEAPYSKELEAPYDGAEHVLRKLSSSYKIGVIANQSVGSTARLMKWGLMPFISTCLCSSEVCLEKPDPAIFKLALNRAGCSASQAVMIGDRLDNDIRPAKLLGWNTIRVAQGFARFQCPRDCWDRADLTVASVDLIEPFLAKNAPA